mgnify:CR=1 FL=1
MCWSRSRRPTVSDRPADIDSKGDRDVTPEQMQDGILHGPSAVQRRAMAKAITLLESSRADHREQADGLLTALLPHTGKAFRLGISGGLSSSFSISLRLGISGSLGSSISKIDSSFHFNGQINITAQSNGYVFQLGYQNGDYVQDGELVMNICDAKSFVFIMNLPYELSAIAAKNYSVQLLLPDSTTLTGTIDKAMPTLDAATQTQQYVIHVSSQKLLPENLLATVLLVKQNKPNTTSLPHTAVLTDETQSAFWVMKMLNDSVAVKVPVSIGIQNETLDEILSPQFSVDDRILISGNYGLDDTAKVILEK